MNNLFFFNFTELLDFWTNTFTKCLQLYIEWFWTQEYCCKSNCCVNYLVTVFIHGWGGSELHVFLEICWFLVWTWKLFPLIILWPYSAPVFTFTKNIHQKTFFAAHLVIHFYLFNAFIAYLLCLQTGYICLEIYTLMVFLDMLKSKFPNSAAGKCSQEEYQDFKLNPGERMR